MHFHITMCLRVLVFGGRALLHARGLWIEQLCTTGPRRARNFLFYFKIQLIIICINRALHLSHANLQ